VMMKLAEKLGKDQAHSLMYEIAMKTAAEGQEFYDNLRGNKQVRANFTDKEIKHMIEPGNYTGLAAHLAEKEAERAKETAEKIRENYSH
jgi:adenylosuccinate lyase